MKEPLEIALAARDNYPLSALLLSPETEPKAAIVLASGTGIVKEFYLHFSHFLAENGYAVLLFDYRGVGKSAPPSLKGFYARQAQWGELDLSAAWDWMTEKYPSISHFHMGHSMGGMIAGLYDQPEKIQGYLIIASGSPNWRFIKGFKGIQTWLLFHVFVPVLTRLMGYFPSSWFGLGVNLPSEIARDWSRWSRSKDFIKPFFGKSISANHYPSVQAPIHTYLIEDDELATIKGRNQLMDLYQNAPKTHHELTLEMSQQKTIGHLGLFSRKHKETLWPILLNRLNNLILPSKPSTT